MRCLCVLACLFSVCVSKSLNSPGCMTAPPTQGTGRVFIELYSANARAKLTVVGNTVITVPWEKRAEHDMKFEWKDKQEGGKSFFVLGTRTKPQQYLAIDAAGSVTIQAELNNSVYFAREKACNSTVTSSSSWMCPDGGWRFFVTHPVARRTTSDSSRSDIIERRSYLAAHSNGDVYGRPTKGRNAVHNNAALKFIECVDWVNERKDCWWTSKK